MSALRPHVHVFKVRSTSRRVRARHHASAYADSMPQGEGQAQVDQPDSEGRSNDRRERVSDDAHVVAALHMEDEARARL